VSREEHNKMEKIENLVWEVAKILSPNAYLEPKIIKKAKQNLIKNLTEG